MKNNKTNASAKTFIVPEGLSAIINYKEEKKCRQIMTTGDVTLKRMKTNPNEFAQHIGPTCQVVLKE